MNAHISIIKCDCGRDITMNDATRTIVHAPPECDLFQGIIERNRKGYAGVPAAEISPNENAEVAMLVAKTPPNDLVAAAEDFGLPSSDPETAARGVLREMRRRGWKISFPM